MRRIDRVIKGIKEHGAKISEYYSQLENMTDEAIVFNYGGTLYRFVHFSCPLFLLEMRVYGVWKLIHDQELILELLKWLFEKDVAESGIEFVDELVEEIANHYEVSPAGGS